MPHKHHLDARDKLNLSIKALGTTPVWLWICSQWRGKQTVGGTCLRIWCTFKRLIAIKTHWQHQKQIALVRYWANIVYLFPRRTPASVWLPTFCSFKQIFCLKHCSLWRDSNLDCLGRRPACWLQLQPRPRPPVIVWFLMSQRAKVGKCSGMSPWPGGYERRLSFRRSWVRFPKINGKGSGDGPFLLHSLR